MVKGVINIVVNTTINIVIYRVSNHPLPTLDWERVRDVEDVEKLMNILFSGMVGAAQDVIKEQKKRKNSWGGKILGESETRGKILGESETSRIVQEYE